MRRGSFLTTLMEDAKEHGTSIYEELQGGSVIRSSIADWNEIVRDTAIGAKDDLDYLAGWISPTIDATPGRYTLEDKIDEAIFDPQSDLAPLEIIAMGAMSGSRAAATGVKHVAKKIGWQVNDLIRTTRAGSRGRTLAKESLDFVAGKADDAVAKVVPKAKPKPKAVEGFAHHTGEASTESIHREAGGTWFARVNNSGKVTPIIQGGEDAAIRAANKTSDAIVRVSNTGNIPESLGRISKLQDDVIRTLTPNKPRDISKAKTHVLDLAKKADDDAFLDGMGVIRGAGPPRKIK